MARVYERPRYINQARNKLLALASATKNVSLSLSVATSLGCSSPIISSMKLDYELLAQLAHEGDMDDYHDINIDNQVADYLVDAEIGRMANAFVLSQPEPATLIVRDYLEVYRINKPRVVLHDEAAMYALLSKAMLDVTPAVESEVNRHARVAAYNLLHHQLLSQKIAPAKFTRNYGGTGMSGPAVSLVARADLWLNAVENIQYRSQPMWVKYCRLWAAPPRRLRPRVANMVDKVSKSLPAERHRFHALEPIAMKDSYSSYNYGGVIIIYWESTMYVMDSSCADYLRTAVTALKNARMAFTMLRIAGDTATYNYSFDLERCIQWIGNAISNSMKARNVARHMHLAYTMWTNEACEDAAPVDCGYKDRVEPLRKDMLSYYPNTTQWWDLVRNIGCPERLRGEFLKLYHLLPPPDIDPLLLHNTLIERTTAANKASPVAIAAFIRFCCAYDFCRFLAKHRRVPSHRVEGEYVFADSPWFKKCKAGKVSLPPENEWGRVRISKEFPYPHTGDFHVLDAKDSTRVVADRGAYVDRAKSRDLPRVDQNELLSAIFNGPILSNGETMESWRNRVMKGGLTDEDHVIAAEAGKAENTKPGKKVRETLSACDTLREYLTEVDHSMRPLAELTPGVSIRVNMVKHKKKFQSMARAVSARSTQHAFATSTDISGWSPKMDRKMFHAWQEYALGTTECENPIAQIPLWDKLEIFVDRRGVKSSAECKTGNIQGWPATSDTTMHAHILIQWALRLRREKILSAKEAAYTLCLIDDAATVVALEGSVEEASAKAAKARELLVSMYLDLGFEMDTVKSFFSSIKFVYLNELYIDGTQVGHGTKTLMRIDKDHTRRFSSLTDNIATAFGTAASASAQGADPFVAYWMAANLAFRWVFDADRRLMDAQPLDLLTFALAPVSLNGLGIRPITSVMASGENDHLTWFIEVVGHLHATVGSQQSRRVFSSFLLQDIQVPTASKTFQNPFSYTAANHSSARASIERSFRDAATTLGLAEPFKSLDLVERGDDYESALHSMLSSGQYEATLLEEVSSNMPWALIQQVLGRIDKTEIVAYLLGGRGIGDLRRSVISADRRNLAVAWDILTSRLQAYGSRDMVAAYEESGSYQVAYLLRDAMYSHTEYLVLNHTYPCPFALWAFAGEIDLTTDKAHFVTTVSFNTTRLRTTAGSNTKNMYDSAPDKTGFRGYITARSDASREMRVRLYDPVRRMIASGISALRWAASNGAHYKAVAKVFLQSWAGHTDERLLTLSGRTLSGSAKRLSLRHTKASHMVYPFQNVQSAVKVDARAITKAQANTSTMYDVMGAITTLRCSGLMEAALGMRLGIGGFSYAFTYKANAAAIMKVPGTSEVELLVPFYEKITPFIEIESPLRKSAIVCCSYESMTELTQQWLDAGTSAANKLFEALIAGEVIDRDMYMQHEQVTESIKEPIATTFDSGTTWKVKPKERVRVRGDVVTEPGSMSTSASVIDTPQLSSQQRIDYAAESWADTILISSVEADPVAMATLANLAYQNKAHEAMSVPNSEKLLSTIQLNDRTLRGMIAEAESIADEGKVRDVIGRMLRGIGVTGYRYKEGDGDILHSIKSFIGTYSSVVGLVNRMGHLMYKLKKKTAQEYAAVQVAQSSHARRAVSRVIKAQWLAAAGRDQVKAATIVASERTGAKATRLNYRAVYARVAAGALRTDGTMNITAFLGVAVTRTIESVRNHLKERNKDEDLDDLLVDEAPDLETDVDNKEAAIRSIQQLCEIARQLDQSVDTVSVVGSFDEVCTWVEQDLAGFHTQYAVKGARKVEFLSQPSIVGQGVQRIIKSQVVDTSEPIFLQPVTVGAEDDTMGDLRMEDPQEVAQWITSNSDARSDLLTTLELTNVHKAYDIWTQSDDFFFSLADRLVATHGLGQFESPGFSVFDEPMWMKEDSEGDVVNE